MKQIAVIGLGYIGLPTAILAAKSGYDVLGFDVDESKICKIKNGDPSIIEPQIKENLLDVLSSEKFEVSSILKPADCFIVAVPTPFKEGKKADLSFVFSAAKSIAKVLKKDDLIILESTIPVGTTELVAEFLERESGLVAKKDFLVAHCPERVLPGRIFYELVKNDRVVGGIDQESCNAAKKFYAAFVEGDIHTTDDKTAEMVKLVENSSRDVQIAFANQVAAMARDAKIDPYEVINLANRHPRVKILNPGCGVGGHCIAVDPWFLIESFPKSTTLLQSARDVNDLRPREIINEVSKLVEKIKQEKNILKVKVLVLGLTFKPGVDDLRESPALKIAKDLNLQKDVDLFACEPNVTSEKISHLGFLSTALNEGLKNCDLIVSLVLHKEFKNIPLNIIQSKLIIDTCGLIHELERGKE
ncbi:TPA: UDP-N-acetyl-D-mannosamine dehydrogenase [Candidatus Dependentiae bacterium]|nr:MAG: NDP-N-acetyl-D-galactosaminuronic acid dehydrogenase [candidate division TM6 bacterium GW2011_GWE2_31_21]KKP54099.1 MAG: NDP-N-acetyl-D-galactosaminuronic acid dehydrogenase [candidate division TM6 bacterium GW2011_GWF2_33_332]HBS48319.1 UDP-N-acetyl-D-mannosamine dehydrogenase [Candidatus Dependentiae bacterium]HBZ73007.1 UDP-N-acetyl-D-mannosamine dehydrogenase [Candidatus Dependentiae bacterium]